MRVPNLLTMAFPCGFVRHPTLPGGSGPIARLRQPWLPRRKRTALLPASTSITLRRGQEILAGDWYGCYESIKNGKPCK
jgi:hypothetical protein